MTTSHAEPVNGKLPHEPEKATLEGRNKLIGFWLFLGGETVLFGTLFATFLALRGQTNDGPTANELFHLPLVAPADVHPPGQRLDECIRHSGDAQGESKFTCLVAGDNGCSGAGIPWSGDLRVLRIREA